MIYLYIALAVLLAGGGGFVGYKLEETKLEALQIADANARTQGEDLVRKTLQVQLDAAKVTANTNAQAMVSLANENAQIAADRDANIALAQRLLSQARLTSPNRVVSKASGGSPAPAASGTSQNEGIAGLLVDAADECDRNADRLDALTAELKPQL